MREREGDLIFELAKPLILASRGELRGEGRKGGRCERDDEALSFTGHWKKLHGLQEKKTLSYVFFFFFFNFNTLFFSTIWLTFPSFFFVHGTLKVYFLHCTLYLVNIKIVNIVVSIICCYYSLSTVTKKALLFG